MYVLFFFVKGYGDHLDLHVLKHSSPTRRSPDLRGSSGDPGTANTLRPWSRARRAVISEPERRAASTTTVATASPAMMWLRDRKFRVSGVVPTGISATTVAASATQRGKSACCAGETTAMPAARSALVPVGRGQIGSGSGQERQGEFE